MADFDFCIFGAGLAGVSLSKELIQRGKKVCLIDVSSVAAGASGTPLGLANPATGRYGTKVWEAEQCLNSLKQNLEEVQPHSKTPFYKNTGVLRPALDKEIAGRMQENLEKKEWAEGWCEWKTCEEIRLFNPEIACVEGGLWLPVGLTVDVAAYLHSMVKYLQSNGLQAYFDARYVLHKADQGWTVSINELNEDLNTKAVVHTAGVDTSDVFLWDFLKLHGVKGQNATLKAPDVVSMDYSISALGYIATMNKGEYVLGSTYEHKFENRDPDQKGLNYLKDRMKKVYPDLIRQGKVMDQWAGVRASTPNKKPVLGTHPYTDGAYVFTGLGSKGLLYSAHLSGLLVRHILNDEGIPELFSVDRFL